MFKSQIHSYCNNVHVSQCTLYNARVESTISKILPKMQKEIKYKNKKLNIQQNACMQSKLKERQARLHANTHTRTQANTKKENDINNNNNNRTSDTFCFLFFFFFPFCCPKKVYTKTRNAS